jgi:hypothetical protein
LRARREQPCRSRAAEQRYERASFQLIELHPLPASSTTFNGHCLMRCTEPLKSKFIVRCAASGPLPESGRPV